MQSDRHSILHLLHTSICHTGLSRLLPDQSAGELADLLDNYQAEADLLRLSAKWREMTQQPGALPPEAAQVQQQQVF